MAFFPSLDAVMVTVPGAAAVTAPVLETVATFEFVLNHATARSGSAPPTESCGVAVSWRVWPTRRLAFDGVVRFTVATGARFVIVADPLLPSLVAVMVAEPGAIAVTRPAELTDAIEGADEDHVVARASSVRLRESLRVAIS